MLIDEPVYLNDTRQLETVIREVGFLKRHERAHALRLSRDGGGISMAVSKTTGTNLGNQRSS